MLVGLGDQHMAQRRDHPQGGEHRPLLRCWGDPEERQRQRHQRRPDNRGLEVQHHGVSPSRHCAGQHQVGPQRHPRPQRQEGAGVHLDHARPDDDQRADKPYGDGGPAAGSDPFPKDKRRKDHDHQRVDEEDRQCIGDGQVFQRLEEQEGRPEQQDRPRQLAQRLRRTEGLRSFCPKGERQGHQPAEQRTGPDHDQDRHAGLAQLLGEDVDDGQDNHRRQHQGHAHQGPRRGGRYANSGQDGPPGRSSSR